MKVWMPLTLVVCVASGAFAQTSDSDDLTAVRTLYASAEYEKALDRLTTIPEGSKSELLTVYRALCQLALGRTSDVEQTLVQLVKTSPGYTLTDQDVSPRLVEMFQSVRRRELPNIARSLYATARTSYQEKRFAEAETQLTTLLAMVKELDASDPTFADLKLLATEFRELARARLSSESAERPRSPDVAAAVGTSDVAAIAPAPAAPTAAPAPAVVFTAADTGIVAPVEVSRVMPPWIPPREFAAGSFVGVLEIVVGENGLVENAIVRQQVSPRYDAALLTAAKNWKYRPATKDGVPVKYRTFVRVVLQGR